MSSSVVLSCQLGYSRARANRGLGNTVYMCSCCSETVTVLLKWTYLQVTFKTLGTAGNVGEG